MVVVVVVVVVVEEEVAIVTERRLHNYSMCIQFHTPSFAFVEQIFV